MTGYGYFTIKKFRFHGLCGIEYKRFRVVFKPVAWGYMLYIGNESFYNNSCIDGKWRPMSHDQLINSIESRLGGAVIKSDFIFMGI